MGGFKMISKWTIAFTCTLLAFCESACVETQKKCEIDDIACHKELIQGIITDISETGIPKCNIFPIDPLDLEGKNIKVPIAGLLDLIIERGKIYGLKKCVVKNVISEYKKGFYALEVTCDLDIEVDARLKELSQLTQKVISIEPGMEGTANANAYLKKLHVKLEYFYDIVKRDGDIYFKCKKDQSRYDFDADEIKIVANKVMFGGKDYSAMVNELFQQNAKFIWNTFGKNVFDVATDILSDIVENFFNNTPTKHIISTDLSPYVKNV